MDYNVWAIFAKVGGDSTSASAHTNEYGLQRTADFRESRGDTTSASVRHNESHAIYYFRVR